MCTPGIMYKYKYNFFILKNSIARFVDVYIYIYYMYYTYIYSTYDSYMYVKQGGIGYVLPIATPLCKPLCN